MADQLTANRQPLGPSDSLTGAMCWRSCGQLTEDNTSHIMICTTLVYKTVPD